MTTPSRVVSWIEKSLEKENLKDYTINITGVSEKDQGYLGEIVFVEAKGTTEENEEKSLHMVVKHAKNNVNLRKSVPVGEVFENEIYMYNSVFPAFLKFQQQRPVTDLFNCIPKLFYSSSSDDIEVLVLENLKMAGFEQFDRMKPMNLAHCKAILEQYGKFHAVSFAVRDQDSETFNNIISNLGDTHILFLEKSNGWSIYKSSFSIVQEMFEKNGDTDLVIKLDGLLKGECDKISEKVLEKMKKDKQTVIMHGDCWCNNYLFKYENGQKDIPSEVMILDWQISSLRSPVFDISYLIYAVCSKTELDSLEELLKAYYASFAKHLTELGSDPEKVFSYADLKRHWKEYSIFGFIHVVAALRIILCDKDKAPSFEDIEEGRDFADFYNNSLGWEPVLYDRIKDVVSHYIEYLDRGNS